MKPEKFDICRATSIKRDAIKSTPGDADVSPCVTELLRLPDSDSGYPALNDQTNRVWRVSKNGPTSKT